MTRSFSRRSRGFSMIEVLVAVVILSVGLLAIASLQMSLIRSSGDSKAQSVAMGLAKEKLDSMRAFTSYDAYRQLTDSSTTGSCSGTLVNCIGGVAYSVNTVVTRYVFDTKPATDTYSSPADDATEAQLTADTGHTYIVGRDFKKVSVTVTWKDVTDVTRTLVLDDVIDGMDPADSAKVAKNTSGTSPRSAEVIIKDPSTEAGVIPIAIGDGTDTAATNPRPVVNESATETRFDIYTYAALNDANNDALAQSRVETNVIGCTCDTATAPTDTGARGYRPTYWNGSRYVAPTLTDYKPDAGQSASNSSSESPYCDVCCRDHEDPASLSSSKPRFDPWRYAKSVAHTHYGLVNGALVAVGGSQTKYIEACRLIRVDGIYRVAADPRDDFFDLLATKNDGSTYEYAPTDTATTNYQNFVLAYLDAKIVSNGTSSTYNSRVASSTVATLSGTSTDTTSIDYPSSITLQRTSDHKYLHSRGLFVDFLEPEALDAIASAKSDCVSSSCTTTQKQAAVLSVLPFTSINLTELANWSPLVNAAQNVAVSNGGFSTAASSDAPVRGYVTPGSNLASGQLTATATSAMRDSTSGLQVLYNSPIDADERDDSTAALSDSQAFAIPAGGGGNNSGSFTVAFSGYSFPVFPSLSGTNITNCTYASVGNGGNATYQYTCNASSLPTSSLALKVSSYNYTAPAAVGLDITCTNGATSKTYHTSGNDTKLVTCKNYEVTAAASNASGVTVSPAYPFTVANSGSVSETTTMTFSTVSNANTLTLTFAGPTTTFAGYSCTYTQTFNDGSPKNPTITSLSASCP